MEKIKKMYRKFRKMLVDNSKKIKKYDLIIMLVLTLIYSTIAFHNLGNIKSPQTFYHFANPESEVTINLVSDSQEISKMRYFSGAEIGTYKLYASNNNLEYTEIGEFKDPDLMVFNWNDVQINSKFKYLKIVSEYGNSYIGEIALYDQYGKRLSIEATNEYSKDIIDEVNTIPGIIGYSNSMYFDEVYFGRSAYEYVHGINTNEWVHPPLGKLLQAIPILLFGMRPFTWRLMGTIAGILMIPVIYIFAKNIFKRRKYAILAALLMMFDCFHFAHTRIGTVDSYLVLFGMLSALFMYKYLQLDKYDSIKPKLKYLGLSGLFFGLSFCVKWTGLYLGLGLLLVFFGKFILDLKKDKKISKQYSKIILWCILFFMIIPLFIYILSYLLFQNVGPYNGVHNIKDIVEQFKNMLKYHSKLDEGHIFSSKWYSWIIMYKPVWTYVSYVGDNLKSVIVSIGNPAVWWAGIPAIIYLIYSSINEKNKNMMFILAFIIATWLPYIFIGRAMFIYHFFPTLPFLILGIVALVKRINEKTKKNSALIIYSLIVIFFFIYFYPIISGKLVTTNLIDTLRWFSNWKF